MYSHLDTLCDELADLKDSWDLIDRLMSGTMSMRRAKQLYLPQYPAESEKQYDLRLETTFLYGAYKRTMQIMAAKPFTRELAIKGGDPRFKEWCENIDRNGRNLHAFAKDVFFHALAYGTSFISVEYPEVQEVVEGQTLTVADEKERGIRPYFIHIRPRQVRGWEIEIIDNVPVMTAFWYRETVKERREALGLSQSVTQIRMITRDKYIIFREGPDHNDPTVMTWNQYREYPNTLGKVHIVPVLGNELSDTLTVRPVLEDMAWLNMEHWQSASDQRNILKVARVPLLVATGLGQNQQIKVGSSVAVELNHGGDLKFVEHTGAAIGAGRVDLIDLQDRMRQMGAELLIKPEGNRTTTDANADASQNESVLQSIARNLEDSLDRTMDFAGQWAKTENVPTTSVFREFGLTGGDAGTTEMVLLKSTEKKLMSKELYFKEMQRRAIISNDETWEEEVKRLKAESLEAQDGAESGDESDQRSDDRKSGNELDSSNLDRMDVLR